MPLPVIAGIHRCALIWDGPGSQLAVNVMHVETGTADPVDAMAFLDGHVASAMWGLVADSAHIATVEITPLDGSAGASVFVPTTAANWDGGTGGACEPAASVIVKLTTGLRGPSHRGRVFLPFIAESSVADGLVTSGDLAAMQAAWTSFVGAGDPDGQLVVASYTNEEAATVTAATVETILGTQKRRQDRLRH